MAASRVLAFDMAIGVIGVYCGWTGRCLSFPTSQQGIHEFLELLYRSHLAIAFSGWTKTIDDYDRHTLFECCEKGSVLVDMKQFEAVYRNVMYDIWQAEGLGCYGKSLFNAATEVFGVGVLELVVLGFSDDNHIRAAQRDAYLAYRLWAERAKRLGLTLLGKPRR